MNSGSQSDDQSEESPGAGLAFGDILFTLFRHKFLIFGGLLLGLISAGIVRVIKPPNFESTAKIYIPYVVNVPSVKGNENEGVVQSSSETVMNTEAEMLKSFDTALDVATNIGPEKILAKYGGGDDLLQAAGVVASGINVAPPITMSLVVTFSHRDRELVQPVMKAIVDAYMRRHLLMRSGNSTYLEQKAEEKAKEIAEIDRQIKLLMTDAGVPDVRERLTAIKKEFDDLQRQLLKSQTEIAQRKAELGEISLSLTNIQANPLPPDAIGNYSDVMGQIDEIKKRQRALLRDGDFTTNHPSVVALETKMQGQIRVKLSLEQQYPTLTNYISALPRTSGSTNGAPRMDLETEMAYINKLMRTMKSDEETLGSLRDEAFKLMDIEPKLSDLERQRKAGEDDYVFFRGSIEKSKVEDNGKGGAINMYRFQAPTPPKLDQKKMQKLMGAAFGAFAGLGLGLAFLMDLIVDRSIRRPSQIIRGLRLPVVLTIPDANREDSTVFFSRRRNGNMKVMRRDNKSEPIDQSRAVAAWRPDNHLQSHIEGLRERVITYFEVKGVEHSPKLVAVTACMDGAGVTTLASGLAAALSGTGNGSVLLVDMNAGEGVTHSFYKGKPGYGPSESIETESDGGSSNMSLAKVSGAARSRHDRLAGILPPSFAELSPKLKADAYDYVVFDMTAITPASVTPRLSGHMDLVLFVIESEKTKDHTARYASDLMRESRANVMAILNKYHNPVPAWLSHD